MHTPSIYGFNDPITYLSECYQSARLDSPELSLSAWLRSLGLPTGSGIIEIFQRKRGFKARHVELFAPVLGLSKDQRRYFQLMTLACRSSDEAEKQIFEEMLSREREIHGRSEPWHWLKMAIAAFALIEKKEITREEVIRAFEAQVPRSEIEYYLDELLHSRVLAVDEAGRIRREAGPITSPNDVRIDSVHTYYRQVSELAARAVDVEVDKREFQCFALPLDTSRLQELKQLVRDFRKKISATAPPGGQEVYQVNLQLFPLTQQAN